MYTGSIISYFEPRIHSKLALKLWATPYRTESLNIKTIGNFLRSSTIHWTTVMTYIAAKSSHNVKIIRSVYTVLSTLCTIQSFFPNIFLSNNRICVFQRDDTKEITFYVKGADSVLIEKVQYNDWLEEEVSRIVEILISDLKYIPLFWKFTYEELLNLWTKIIFMQDFFLNPYKRNCWY